METLTVVRHASLPGALFFRGYVSESHFLALNESVPGELLFRIVGEVVRLYTDECVILFHS